MGSAGSLRFSLHGRPLETNPADLFGGPFGFSLQRERDTSENPADLLGGSFGFSLRPTES
jgi:hypothetical protein